MKRGIQKVFAMGLSIALFTELLSSSAVGSVTMTQPQKGEQTESAGMSYREGEALVILKTDTENETDTQIEDATSASLAKDGMTVEKILSFDGAVTDEEDATKATKDTKDSEQMEELHIGVIRSETLTTKEMLEKLDKNKRIEVAEPNYIQQISGLTNDSLTEYQWSLENEGQNGGTAGADLNPEFVWNGEEGITPTTGTDDVIAVVDSGMDFTHPDLQGVLWQNRYQGVLPGANGYDFVAGDDKPQDENGHGTHCCGIIAADGNNGIGISGVNQHAKLMILRVLDAAGYGDQSSIISAYNYIYRALQLGVPVKAVNNSWEGGYGEILTRVINKVGEAGAISVFAAGNDGKNLDIDIGETPSEQAKLNSPYVITVAATNEKDELATFSNYGKKTVTLAAPGTDILSTTATKEALTPQIQTKEEQEKTCTFYQSYDQLDMPAYTKQEDGSVTADAPVSEGMPDRVELRRSGKEISRNADISISLSEQNFFGKKGGKSLQISVKGAKKGDMLYAMIPYMAPPDQKTIPTVSAMVQAYRTTSSPQDVASFVLNECTSEDVENLTKMHGIGCFSVNFADVQESSSGLDWTQLYGVCSEKNLSGQPQARDIVLQVTCTKDGDYQFYIDDLAISNGNETEETRDFGRYEFMSGTSMAAPHVTGAVALIAAAYKDRSPQEIVNMLKSSVRKTAELEEKTVSGGVLDLSKLSSPTPFISNAVYEKDGKLHLKGYGFLPNHTNVWVDEREVELNVLSETEIVLEGDWFKNNCAKVTVETPYGTTSQTFYLIKGKKAYQSQGSLGGYTNYDELNRAKKMKQGQILTDGRKIFFYEADSGCISEISLSSEENDDEYMLSDAYADIVYRYDLTETPLADGTQSQEETCRAVSNLVYLNHRLYFLMSRQKPEDVSVEVVLASYDIESQTGDLIGSLPERYQNRTGMSLGVLCGKLYVIGGYDYGEKQMVNEMIEASAISKGKTGWKAAPSLPQNRASGICTQDGKELYYALGMADSLENCPQTLAFNGKKWRVLDGTPDALTSDTKTFDGKTYSIYQGNIDVVKGQILYSGFPCNGLGDTFLQNTETGELKPTEYNCVEDVENEAFIGTVVGDELFGIMADDSGTEIRTQKIGSSLVPVKTSVKGNGKLRLTPSVCLPGETITIKAEPVKGAYLKKLIVNGKTISRNSISLYAVDGVTVSAEFCNYVQKIKVKKQKSGKKVQLKAVITPADAANKTVKWTSSNSKYATISQKGVITVKKSGIGKTVKFTATAKDGSKVKQVYKVKLR